jgi:hypothetical protein
MVYPGCGMYSVLGSAFGKDDCKFVSSDSGSRIHDAHGLSERPSEAFEGIVSGEMAALIVDQLELVDIEHKEATGPTRAGASVHFPCQSSLKKAGIHQASKTIVYGKVAESVDKDL